MQQGRRSTGYRQSIKKQPLLLQEPLIWLGWKDLNPRNDGVRVHCLTAWLHPSLFSVVCISRLDYYITIPERCQPISEKQKKEKKVEFVLKNQMLNIDCTIEIKRFVLIFTVHFSKLTFCSWHDIMAIPHKERLATLHAICLQISLQSLFRIFPHASCVHIFRDISGKYSKIHKGFSPFSPSSLKKSDDAICIRQIRNRLSYFTKMLVNTSSIHSAFCFI